MKHSGPEVPWELPTQLCTQQVQWRINTAFWCSGLALDCLNAKPCSQKSVLSNISHLPKGCPGLLKATHLQSFFEHVERVGEGFAEDSGAAPTDKVFQVA